MSRYVVRKRVGSSLLEHLVKSRNFSDSELEADFSMLHSFSLLPNIDRALELFVKAIAEKRKILIVGDYDADGTPATAILAKLCQLFNTVPDIFIPTREEGYGFTVEIARKALSTNIGTIITVDNGITAVEATAFAIENSIDVIILDHHLPKNELPPTQALVDPFLKDSKYPFAQICASAVAFKFAQAVAQRYPKKVSEAFLKWLLDLVMISTVSDMMPLRDENRVFVKYGLIVAKKNKRPGLAALCEQAGIAAEELSAGKIGFVIGPRINAGGRIDSNMPAYELLMTDVRAEATRLAKLIEQTNSKRMQLLEQTTAQAEELIFKQNSKSDKILLIQNSAWSTGIMGLVASRIAQKYHRPTLVGTFEDEIITGSGRSIPSYPLINGLDSVAKYFVRYGGHEQAAGFTIKQKDWKPMVEQLKKNVATALTDEQLIKTVKIDAILEDKDLEYASVRELNKLEPFGMGNPTPIFALRAKVVKKRIIGNGNKHLSLKLETPEGRAIDAVYWGGASADLPDTITVIGNLDINTWNGADNVRLTISDILNEQEKIELDE